MDGLNREILRLAIPSIFANITVPLVGMVGLAVAGHLTGPGGVGAAAFIGGMSIGAMLFDLLYWNFGFLRAGTGGLTAQAFGRGDMRECGLIFARAFGIALAVAAVILLLQWPFIQLCFAFIKCSPKVKELASQYFYIRVWAAPATLSLMGFKGWFIGMQDSFSSMMCDVIVNVINIAASLALALGLGDWAGMGFPGIALGTVIAQYCGLSYAIFTMTAKYRRRVFSALRREDVSEVFRGEQMRRFLAMNANIFVRSVCFIAIYIGFTVISASYGDLMLATGTIMMNLMLLFSYVTDGFAYAGEALTGRFIGEGSKTLTRRTVKWVFIWSMSLAAIFTLLYTVSGVPLLRMMTSDVEVIEACREFLPWLVVTPMVGCAAFTWDGIYLGATASRGVRNAMIVAALAFFGCYFLGYLWMDSADLTEVRRNATAIHLLMVGYFAHLLARTVLLTAQYRREVIRSNFPDLESLT